MATWLELTNMSLDDKPTKVTMHEATGMLRLQNTAAQGLLLLEAKTPVTFPDRMVDIIVFDPAGMVFKVCEMGITKTTSLDGLILGLQCWTEQTPEKDNGLRYLDKLVVVDIEVRLFTATTSSLPHIRGTPVFIGKPCSKFDRSLRVIS
jgi:hypothetical protein